jgi:membrane protease YdiL (CAAX protease family)
MLVIRLLHHAFVLFLIVLFPLWDWHETRRLKASTDPRDRVRAYRQTIAWQLAATALLLATMPLSRLFTPPAAGKLLGVEVNTRMVLPVLVGLLIGAGLPVLISLRGRKGGSPAVPGLEKIAFFLPRTREERLWFACVAITVGVCEEIIYRGFLIRYMQSLPFGLTVAGAVVAAALVFGIDHGYQGWQGLLGTTVLALVMSALFIAAGALWVPMIVHALIDLRVLLLVPPSTGDGAHDGSSGPAEAEA